MALSELAAIEAAYHALLSLDEPGRIRALRWLSDALGTPAPLAELSLPAAASAASDDQQAPAGHAARPAPRTTRRRAAAGDPAGKAPRNTDTAAPRRGRRRTETGPTPAGERVYRRMPAAEEVLAAYQKAGTVSGLAAQFGVPTHTAQGWARRLRQKGHQIGRQR